MVDCSFASARPGGVPRTQLAPELKLGHLSIYITLAHIFKDTHLDSRIKEAESTDSPEIAVYKYPVLMMYLSVKEARQIWAGF
jgi:hypothetical protein